MVYFFFPETSGLEMEDIDHLFERGGLTGGVFETRGRTVEPGYHRAQFGISTEKATAEHEP